MCSKVGQRVPPAWREGGAKKQKLGKQEAQITKAKAENLKLLFNQVVL